MNFNKSHMNQTVLINIIKACHKADKQGLAHVENKHGHAFLRVQKVLNQDNKPCYKITDKTGKNVVQAISYGTMKNFVNCNSYHNRLSFVNKNIAYNYEINYKG